MEFIVYKKLKCFKNPKQIILYIFLIKLTVPKMLNGCNLIMSTFRKNWIAVYPKKKKESYQKLIVTLLSITHEMYFWGVLIGEERESWFFSPKYLRNFKISIKIVWYMFLITPMVPRYLRVTIYFYHTIMWTYSVIN